MGCASRPHLYCNSCGGELEPLQVGKKKRWWWDGFDAITKQRDRARSAGWKCEHVNDEWSDICPACLAATPVSVELSYNMLLSIPLVITSGESAPLPGDRKQLEAWLDEHLTNLLEDMTVAQIVEKLAAADLQKVNGRTSIDEEQERWGLSYY